MKHVPLLGALLSVVLFAFASTLYPGGTRLDPTTVGYSWGENTISALFQPFAVNGEVNPARWYAIVAVFIFCCSIGMVFQQIAQITQTEPHQNWIRGAGISTVVFAFLVVTPLHHVMVSIALLCFLVASLTLNHWLYLRNHRGLLALGILAIVLPLINAILFYGQIGAQWLPIVQKSGKFAAFIWLFAVYYAALRPRK
ncbi:MAG: hypothetical protein LAT53_05525 [Idiomarina sp.]|nr:hypothetical protein [Idiomarina sp.]